MTVTKQTLPNDVVVWVPQHEGHAPPFWRDDMPWDAGGIFDSSVFSPEDAEPHWHLQLTHFVPREAVYGPAPESVAPSIAKYTDEQLAALGLQRIPTPAYVQTPIERAYCQYQVLANPKDGATVKKWIAHKGAVSTKDFPAFKQSVQELLEGDGR